VAACVQTQGTLTRSVVRQPTDADRVSYVHELKVRAHHLRLAQKTEWLRLGHYRKGWSGSWESEADGNNFFLSPHGKESAQLELDATLEGFFADLAPYDAKNPDNKSIQHPICQFPARLMWLTEQLQIDPAKLPKADCSRYQKFVETVHVESVTLVFSAYYLNNPASAFGHTFLRLHKNEPTVSDERRQLLDFGIEFSADPDTTFAPLYAIKGLVGAFPGTFRKLPYYYKIRQYNDYESRDLWEYKLHMTQHEIDMLVAHVWELGSTFFDYWYLSENCSYHLLGLLEAALPDRELLDSMHWPTIPADAIRAVTDEPGLVEKVEFRPSSRTRFNQEIAALSSSQLTAVADLSTDPKRPLALSDRDRIAVFDAAQDLVDIKYAKALAHDENKGEAAEIKQTLLERRAEILVPSPDMTYSTPLHKMPQLGHDTRRISAGASSSRDGQWLEVGARLALHDLADSTDGYPELSQLEFLPTRARYDFHSERFRLDSLDLVDVVSLTSQNRFDRHISWQFRLGSQHFEDSGCVPGNCYGGHVAIGGGTAFSTESEGLTLFFFANTQIWAARGLDALFGTPIRAGIGPGGGIRWRLHRHLVALATGEWNWLPAQKGFAVWNAIGTLRWSILRDLSLELQVRDEYETPSGTFSTLLYF
jgi:hypothetical protein